MEHTAKRLRRASSSPLQVESSNSSNDSESDTSVEDYEAIPLTECPYVGLKVDVLDTEKIWASAMIISSKKNTDCSDTTKLEGEYQVTISYDGWGPEWDETLPYPNTRVVRHFTFSRRVKAFVDIQASKQKYSSSTTPEPMIFWPCQVQIRMPNINNDVAAYFLELEENIYVEPYLPNDSSSPTSLPPALRRLFPICHLGNQRQDDVDQRFIPGTWLPTKWLRQFRKFDFSMFSQHQLRFQFPLPGFLSAYEVAMNDPTTLGTLPKRLFVKGSLVNDKYRVWEQNEPGLNYTGEFSDEPNRSTASASSVIHENRRYVPPWNHARKDLGQPPKLPPCVKVMETLYPRTTKCADTKNYEWFGVITSGGGNDIIVGKFSSQTEAHEAATLAITQQAGDHQSKTETRQEEENDVKLAAKNMEVCTYEKRLSPKKVGSKMITSIETHPLVDMNLLLSTRTDQPPRVEDDQNLSTINYDPNNMLSTRNKCSPTPVLLTSNDKKTESETSCEADINRQWKTPSGRVSLIGASSEDSKPLAKRLPGSYSVNIPITSEGLLLQVATPLKSLAESMPNYSCTFQGYRRYSDGRLGESELQNLIRGVGDWIVEVDGESTENLLLNQTLEMVQRKIEEKRNKNIKNLQVVLVDCKSVLSSRKANPSSGLIDLTLDDDLNVNRNEQGTTNNLKVTDESPCRLNISTINVDLHKDNQKIQACDDYKMHNENATIEPADLVGAYTVHIPIDTEGIPLSIGPPSDALRNELPNFSCTFQGYRKKSDGQKSATEQQNAIHGIGDWITNVEGVSMKNMAFNQVMQTIMGKIEENRRKKSSELRITLVDCSSLTSKETAIASARPIDLTLDDEECDDKNDFVPHGSNMDKSASNAEIGEMNHAIQTTDDEKCDDAVAPSGDDLHWKKASPIKPLLNSDDLTAAAEEVFDSELTKMKSLTDGARVKSFIREHADTVKNSQDSQEINVRRAVPCAPESEVEVAISTHQAVATQDDAEIVSDSIFGLESSVEALDIIDLSSDSDTVLITRDFNWKEEEDVCIDETKSSVYRNDSLTPKVDLFPSGLESASKSSELEEISSSLSQVMPSDLIEMPKDPTHLSLDDCQTPTNLLSPILARKVKIGSGVEEDLQKISLEAVVTAVESMFNPTLHTFSMQEWTIELIRHKAYLKEVSLGGEYQAVKSSGDDTKIPYDSPRMSPSEAHNTVARPHARKQGIPRKLLL